MTPEFNEAYRKGWRAWEDGQERDENPYTKPERVERAAWTQGYLEREMKAQEQARRERRSVDNFLKNNPS